jgi:hypothetical protein
MSLLQDLTATEPEEGAEGAEPAETPPGNRGKLLIGLLVLLAMGIGAVALILTLAPWANAVGGCGGG